MMSVEGLVTQKSVMGNLEVKEDKWNNWVKSGGDWETLSLRLIESRILTLTIMK